MGIDREEVAGGGARNGGQADFLMLLLIDPVGKTVRPLEIDRDTMTRITVWAYWETSPVPEKRRSAFRTALGTEARRAVC
jgi:anionic cell wall polymer biosynthesis LytR-Cps2A-Psr (LCP) family protein